MGLTAVVGSGLVLGQAAPAAAIEDQYGWRWCNRCQCLFYNPSADSAGLCAAGGAHYGNAATSYDYRAFYDHTASYAQGGWAYCNRCQSMHYASANGWCPGSGHHVQGGSHNYSLFHDITDVQKYQSGWKYCNKCRNVAYGSGPCAAGGLHYLIGSLDYGFDYR